MVLISGGCGYLGSLLVPELLRMGESVNVIDSQEFPHKLAGHKNLHLIQENLETMNLSWEFAGGKVDSIIHLAGLSNDPTADFDPAMNTCSNFYATKRLADWAVSLGHKIRFIYASTCSVYYTKGEEVGMRTEESLAAPMNPYSRTKMLAEVYLLDLAEKYPNFCPVILRKGTLFGYAPRMRFDLVVNAFTAHAWKNEELVVFGAGEQWRPLLHVEDAVNIYIYCLSLPEQSVRGQIFNLLHKNYRVLELAHWVAEIIAKNFDRDIMVHRDRTGGDLGTRSYLVSAEKCKSRLGLEAKLGVSRAVIDIWDRLEAGEFGNSPLEDKKYFNIKWMTEKKK